MRFALLSFIVICVTSLALGQEEQKLVEYAPKDAGFRVQFPEKPKEQTHKVTGGSLYLAGVERKGTDSLSFICAWSYKQPPTDKKGREEYLKDYQIGILDSIKGKLVSDKELELHGNPGREYFASVDKTNVVSARTYVVGKLVLNLQVWGKDADSVRSETAVKFLNSLEFTNK